jgi:hypothetical protein
MPRSTTDADAREASAYSLPIAVLELHLSCDQHSPDPARI